MRGRIQVWTVGSILGALLSGCGGGTAGPEPKSSEPEVADTEEGTGVVENGAASAAGCVSDGDCVPSSCCHPDACVPRSAAPACGEVMCTMDCRPGTLDCGAGACGCEAGACMVRWSE